MYKVMASVSLAISMLFIIIGAADIDPAFELIAVGFFIGILGVLELTVWVIVEGIKKYESPFSGLVV